MEHIGQLMMIGFSGCMPDAHTLRLLREERVGSAIIFARNIESKQQLRRLTQTLQEAADGRLLIAVDHEGGRVFRMPDPFTRFPSMAKVARIAAREGHDIVFEMGRAMGLELSAAGINWNMAPVLDVNTNPFNPVIGDRAFSADPHIVADLACQLMQGLAAGGVLSCGKHFPGHGDSNQDSHLEFARVPNTRKRFDVCEFVPFRAAIAAEVPALMTAHLIAPLLDDDIPATISHEIVTVILRRELGYEGVVLTDDLLMLGMARLMPPPQAAVEAIRAGCDIAMICRDALLQSQAIAELKAAVASGCISGARVQQSSARVDKLRLQLEAIHQMPDLSVIGCAAHQKLARRFA